MSSKSKLCLPPRVSGGQSDRGVECENDHTCLTSRFDRCRLRAGLEQPQLQRRSNAVDSPLSTKQTSTQSAVGQLKPEYRAYVDRLGDLETENHALVVQAADLSRSLPR